MKVIAQVISGCLATASWSVNVLHFNLVTKSPLVYFDVPNSTVSNKLLTMCNSTYTFHMQFNWLQADVCFALQVTKSPLVYYTMPNFIVRNKWEIPHLLLHAQVDVLHIKLVTKLHISVRQKPEKNVAYYVQLYIANPPGRCFYTLH